MLFLKVKMQFFTVFFRSAIPPVRPLEIASDLQYICITFDKATNRITNQSNLLIMSDLTFNNKGTQANGTNRGNNIFMVPVTDFTFKKIFATERNKRFLIDFLNAAVSSYVGEIADLTYLPTEKYGLLPGEKRVVFDIACTDTQGREFIIEMQHARQPEFVDRTLFYLSRFISGGMRSGERRYHIVPTYSVNLLDFELPEFRHSDECFRAIFLKDQNNRILTKKSGVFYLNLCNFAAQQEDVSAELRQWLYVLKNMQDFGEADYERQEGIFQDLLDECRISKMSKMEKENYEKSILEYEDVQEAIAYARELAAKEAYGKGVKEGMVKGVEEGMEKGVEKGMSKGIEKGRAEAIASFVRNMLEKGMDLATISSVTGLAEDEINKMAE